MVNDRQSLDLTTFADPSGGPLVEWRISDSAVPYPEAVAAMTRTRRVEPESARIDVCAARYRKWREVYGLLQTWTL